MNQVISMAGIHCVGAERGDYAAFLNRINEAGRRLSVVKVRDNFGAIDEPLALWPDVLTIGAMTDWDDAGYDVDLAVVRIGEAARRNPGIKYWEYFNERSGAYQQQADFYIALMPRLYVAGVGLCMFNCASGTPPYPYEDNDAAYAEIARACKFARDGGFDVLLGLHEYRSDGGTIGRFRSLQNYLEIINASIPIVVTEYGTETFTNVNDFMAIVKTQDPIYREHDIPCALWTLGGSGWQGSNFASALPQLGEYIATVSPTPESTDSESYSGEFTAYAMQIEDSNGSIWYLDLPYNKDAGYRVMCDEKQFAGGQAEAIVYHDHQVYCTNHAGDWYRADATAWTRVAGDPRRAVPPIPTPAPAPEPFWCAYPVGGSESMRVTDHFNAPRTYANLKHEGTDFDAYQNLIGVNAPILAAQDGIIEYINTHLGTSYGLHVVIRHPWGDEAYRYRTLYAHLSSVMVSVGQTVVRGQQIGVSGRTGTAAIHLHFGVYDAVKGLKGYVLCSDCSALWPGGVLDPESVLRVVEPPVVSTAWRGLHMRADGHSTDLDLACIPLADLNAAKIMTNTGFDEMQMLIGGGLTPDHIVLRLFAAGDNLSLKNAALFFDEQRAWLAEFARVGGRYVEVHNEPNLIDEGFMTAWATAEVFGGWYEAVARLIRVNFPTLLIGWPGLSPQPNVVDFFPVLKASIAAGLVDWIGAHSYWTTAAQMDGNEHGRWYRRVLGYGKPVIITEFSNNVAIDSDVEKGRQYKQYYASLDAGVLGAFAFVVSASDPAFNARRESWVRAGVISEIPVEVGK